MTDPAADNITLDARGADAVAEQLRQRAPGYLPDWRPADTAHEPGNALLAITARYIDALIRRLNQAPAKNKLAFLDMLGIDLIPPSSARVVMVVKLTDKAADARLPAGTQFTAPPPPDSNSQVYFETDQATGLAAAKLAQILSLWPGRDQFIDHTADLIAGHPLRPFYLPLLQNTPHCLYIAHSTLLKLAGKSTVNIRFSFSPPGNEHREIIWEYFDGKNWREFLYQNPRCDSAQQDRKNAAGNSGILGMTRSGTLTLESYCAKSGTTTIDNIESCWIRGRLLDPLPMDPTLLLPVVDQILLSTVIDEAIPVVNTSSAGHTVVGGLRPTKAQNDAVALDVSKTFFPFGQQPLPGAAFYLSLDEAFRPNANVTIAYVNASTPQHITASSGVDLSGKVQLLWEYFDGNIWAPLNVTKVSPGPATPEIAITGDGVLQFTVPADIAPTKVFNQNGTWIRSRIITGVYGAQITITSVTPNISYVVLDPPAFSDFRIGYHWESKPVSPEHVVTYNDFHYEDHTAGAIYGGTTFRPFSQMSDVTPGLYLGFTKQLPVDRIAVFFDVVEDPQDTLGPALEWEYFDGFEWQHLPADDETRNLRVPGLLSFIAEDDAQPLARFGDPPLYWVRGRLKEDGDPGAPILDGVYSNAVWAVQRRTITDDPVGTSDGRANQVFVFRQIPVLDEEQVEVCELSGPRAEVEWRLLVAELNSGDTTAVREIESMLAAEGPQLEVVLDPVRFRRDRNKKVTEVWVRWEVTVHVRASGPNDRHYELARALGRISFGDGEHGKVPPAGAGILARQYRTGGGSAGNAAAGQINQVLGAAGAIDSVTNPHAAEGGADAEPLWQASQRGPQTVRHRGRALLPQDYEVMAKEASPAVAVAHAVPCRDPSGHQAAGWVTLVIIPQSDAPRPWPTFGLREVVRLYLDERAPAGVVSPGRIYITGPDYVEVGIDATIVPVDISQAGQVEQDVRAALERFLHPLTGGPDGKGWPVGRDVFASDVYALVEGVAGVDYAEELLLLLDDVPVGERLKVGSRRTVVAGDIRIKVLAS